MRKKMAQLMIVVTLLLVLTPLVMAANLGDRTLKEGSRGNDVVELQRKLNALGFWPGSLDGVFGSMTKKAVKSFQESKGISTDGIAGPQTIRALNNSSTSYRGNVGRFSSRDAELLAKLVYAEARGEPYLGQVAVAATILNRLKDPEYPKTISEIIFQVVGGRYQFSPVLDGQIYMTPDGTARRAVMDALNGIDPTGGATVFYNPNKTDDKWVRSRPYITTIGNHVFSK